MRRVLGDAGIRVVQTPLQAPNVRTSRHRGKLFYRLVQQAVAVDPAPYASLIKHVRPGKRRRRRHKM